MNFYLTQVLFLLYPLHTSHDFRQFLLCFIHIAHARVHAIIASEPFAEPN